MASIAPGMLTRTASSSSTSSSLSSLSRSPSRTRPRSPSISSSSSSSSSPSHRPEPASDDDELAPTAPTAAALDPWTRRALRYGFDPAQLQPARCEWGNGACGQEFWEVEPLVEHVHNVHAFPQDAPGAPPVPKRGAGAPALSYICDWAGCPRRGKQQGSKFALVAHLRSHTGEKPFICPRAECDKSFTRTDALQKHMRVQHGDKIAAAKGGAGGEGSAPGGSAGGATAATRGGGAGAGKKGKGKAGKRGAAAAGLSDDSADEAMALDGDGDYAAPGGGGGGGADASLEVAYSPDELHAMNLHADLPPAFVAHVVAKAKCAYVVREHEELAHELEALSRRERELEAENEALLRMVLRKEVAPAEDPAGQAALDQFLTRYAHEPRPYPDDWVAGK